MKMYYRYYQLFTEHMIVKNKTYAKQVEKFHTMYIFNNYRDILKANIDKSYDNGH